MAYKKIIFVCTGNTCRSPMAEAAFRKELKRRKIVGFSVRSAGLHAEEGAPMSGESVQALREAKIPFREKFASKQLTQRMIARAFAVVCMTDLQRRRLQKYSSNVTSFYALCGREIPDPYGAGIDAYRATLRRIRECFPAIIAALRMEAISEEEKARKAQAAAARQESGKRPEKDNTVRNT